MTLSISGNSPVIVSGVLTMAVPPPALLTWDGTAYGSIQSALATESGGYMDSVRLTDTKSVFSAHHSTTFGSRVVDRSGTTLTAGTIMPAIDPANPTFVESIALDSTRFMVIWQHSSGASAEIRARVGTVSGGTITYGTVVTVEAVASATAPVITLLDTDTVLASWAVAATTQNAMVMTISGDVITTNSTSSFTFAGSNQRLDTISPTKAILASGNGSNNQTGAKVLSISGTVITAGATKVVHATYGATPASVVLSPTEIAIAYRTGTGGSGEVYVQLYTLSGTTLTASGAALYVDTGLSVQIAPTMDATLVKTNQFILAWTKNTGVLNSIAVELEAGVLALQSIVQLSANALIMTISPTDNSTGAVVLYHNATGKLDGIVLQGT